MDISIRHTVPCVSSRDYCRHRRRRQSVSQSVSQTALTRKIPCLPVGERASSINRLLKSSSLALVQV